MLQAILLEALRAAPDIEIEMTDRVPVQADAALMSETGPHDPAASGAPVTVVVAADGHAATVHRPGAPPQRHRELSREWLLGIIRDTAPQPPRRGFWQRLFGRCEPPPDDGMGPLWLRPPHTASDAEFARLAAALLRRRQGEPGPGPQGDLVRLAREVASAGRSDETLPGLDRLSATFELQPAERDLLLLASLVEVDPRAARLVALINDHLQRTRPTPGLLAELGHSTPDAVARLIAPGPLIRHGLIALEGDGPVSTRPVAAPADVWPLVLGYPHPPPFERRSLEHPQDDGLALSEADRIAVARVAEAAKAAPAAGVLVAVTGEAGVGRTEIACMAARHLARHALVVPAGRLAEAGALTALGRECRLDPAAVVVTGTETLDLDLWTRATAALPAPIFVTTLPDRLGRLYVAARRSVTELPAPRRDLPQRRRMWRTAAPDLPAPALDDLAQRFDFGRDRIRAALGLAAGGAAAGNRGAPDAADLRRACDTLRDTRFDGLAERLACPFAPDDIVLRPETPTELDLATAWARHGARLFADDGPGARLHAGCGLACLFSGPPGTGKTMAAQIIAAEVDYALYRIDLSQVIDKFIGESEKRLSQLFDEAERSRVALFFDEADALFGKRTKVRDSHDRYANITVDHLLQRLDGFDGLAILATNLAGNIDDAFLRRVRVRAEFQAPDAGDRRRIWDRMLPPARHRAADIDLDLLSGGFELVGGEIRNAVYTAHLIAAEAGRPVDMSDCVRGLWRELQKVGRLVDPQHLGPWHAVVSGAGGFAMRGVRPPDPRAAPLAGRQGLA